MITVRKISDDTYEVSATPPHVQEAWSSTKPIHGHQLVRELIERGAHQQDIGDAIYEQDPRWVEKSRDPYIPPVIGKNANESKQ